MEILRKKERAREWVLFLQDGCPVTKGILIHTDKRMCEDREKKINMSKLREGLEEINLADVWISDFQL